MNKLLLGLLGLFNGVWEKMGVDPQHLRTILEAKLTMDGRRKTAFNYRQSAKKKEIKGQDVLVIFMMGLMGLMFMFFVLFFQHTASGVFFYLSFWMAILALTLISDFTDVLIDVRDNYILLPRPITGKTLAVSRIMHVLFYLTKLTIPFSLPGLIGVGIKFGPLAVLLLAFLILLSVLLTIFLVNILYMLMLNLLSPRKFKEIINYFQIAFYAFMFLGYQILPRLIDFNEQGGGIFLNKVYLWFLPSMWLANLWEIAFHFQQPWTSYLLGSLGLLSPFLAIYLVATVLSKNFTQKMFSIGEGGSGAESSAEVKEKKAAKSGSSWMTITANWFCPTKLERGIYELSWKLMGRSRDFKLKFYPNLIMLPVYFAFSIVYPLLQSSKSVFEELRQGQLYLFGYYFSMIILMSGLAILQFSERYKASWFYRSAPLVTPGVILTGSFKAMIVKFYLPIYLILTVFSVSFWGWRVFDDALLAFFSILALTTGVAMITVNVLPFTKSWDEATRGTNFGFTMLTMIFASLFGFFHYTISSYNWLVWLLIPVFAGFYFLVMRNYGKMKWKSVVWE
jgi:hypothetical protein